MIASTADFISPWIWGSLGLIVVIALGCLVSMIGLALILRYLFRGGMKG
jgi:hypothetical protein